ncbi:MAG: glycosyltransferase family 2 protein [Ignavibacteria bacterium]
MINRTTFENMNYAGSAKGLLKILPAPPRGKKGWPWTTETDPRIYDRQSTFPKISIMTPSYNQGEFIEQTIRSVLLQNHPNFEYVIIDGGSTDKTFEIIKKYEPWIKYWVSEKDKGQSNAINKGILKCDGDIFNWINSDDYYYPECFRILAENFDLKKDHIVVGNYRFFDDAGERSERIIDFRLRDSLEETIAYVLINQPSTFFRLDILKSLGELDERLSYVMDQDIWKKYLFRFGQNNIKILDKDLTHFRFHSQSKTSQFYFNNEYISIFHSIALKAGMNKQADFIKRVYEKDVTDNFDFKYDFSKDEIRLAKKVINNFIYLKARNSYTSENYDLLSSCLEIIETRWLNEKQKDYVLKLKVKSKLIKYKLSSVLKLISRKPKKDKPKKGSKSGTSLFKILIT